MSITYDQKPWPGVGHIRIVMNGGAICACEVRTDAGDFSPAFARKADLADILDEIIKTHTTTTPLDLGAATPFQRRVYDQLLEIPYGRTRSYKDIARAIGHPAACRAVAGACHRNPVGVIVPCHRVVGSDGSLTGYAGGLDVKRKLLEIEHAAG
jgi:O-6-methylguanine DNA methyltransferase